MTTATHPKQAIKLDKEGAKEVEEAIEEILKVGVAVLVEVAIKELDIILKMTVLKEILL